MSLQRRLQRLEACYPLPDPPALCPQQAAWLASLPAPEQLPAAAALLFPAAHPARDQWEAAWRDWLAGVARAEQQEDAAKVGAWRAFVAQQQAGGSSVVYPAAAESWANYRHYRRTGWPQYFDCHAETCTCWQWVQAQPDAPPLGAAQDLQPRGRDPQ